MLHMTPLLSDACLLPTCFLFMLACRRLACWRACSCRCKKRQMLGASRARLLRPRRQRLGPRQLATRWRRAAALGCSMPLLQMQRRCRRSWCAFKKFGRPGASWRQLRQSGRRREWSCRRNRPWPARRLRLLHRPARRRRPAAAAARRGWPGRDQWHRWPPQQVVVPSRAEAPLGRPRRQQRDGEGPSIAGGSGSSSGGGRAGMCACECSPEQGCASVTSL